MQPINPEKMTIKFALRFCGLILMFFSTLLPASNYNRIVSLDICTDWMLTRYADRSDIVALSPLLYDYPEQLGQLDWPTHDGTLEQILELAPDLVITGEYNAIILRKRLEELGIRVEVLSLPRSLVSLRDYIQRFLNIIGNKDIKVPSLPGPGKVAVDAPRLLLLGANGIGTGTTTLEHEILQQAGWRNYITRSGYGNVDMELLVSDPPDAILWSAPASRALANMFFEHPALRQAMLNKPTLEIDYGKWQCAGPWTWQQVQQLTGLRNKWHTN